MNQSNTMMLQEKTSTSSAALFTLALRLVVGWTYFSAFWRRMVIDNKMIPEEAGYIGEKFNHFLPNALGIKPIIEFLVSNPEWLWWAMVAFTIIEAIVGLFIMLGLFTRVMSVGVFGLAMGILLGSGWLGTTCLDEWQIGVLGVATGFGLMLSGGGKYSLDSIIAPKLIKKFGDIKWIPLLTSGDLPISERKLHKLVLPVALLILSLTLFTNQMFHNGVWGDLHNMSVTPKVEISEGKFVDDKLSFQLFRVEGADVYGSFLIGIDLIDSKGDKIISLDGEALSKFPKTDILNLYVAKIKTGKHSMILPLGAKATLQMQNEALRNAPKGEYKLKLTDISGLTWTKQIVK